MSGSVLGAHPAGLHYDSERLSREQCGQSTQWHMVKRGHSVIRCGWDTPGKEDPMTTELEEPDRQDVRSAWTSPASPPPAPSLCTWMTSIPDTHTAAGVTNLRQDEQFVVNPLPLHVFKRRWPGCYVRRNREGFSQVHRHRKGCQSRLH